MHDQTSLGPTIIPERLISDLASLAKIGATADGGVTRLAYTPEDAAVRAWLREQLSDLGLQVHTDAVGSTFGSYRPSGSAGDEPVVLLGSHLDSVPNGGHYDGALGVAAALAAARALLAAGRPAHPFTIACWTDEEGARFGAGLFGSRAATGDATDAELDASRDANGVSRRDAMRAFGLDPVALATATLVPGAARAYLELHIEQGANLTDSGIDIGIVEGIVGISRFEITFHGMANHAGTTPMRLRHDALRGAARLTLAVPEIVANHGGPRSVGTVGQISVSPGAANVIPGEARVTVELRDLSTEKLAAMGAAVAAAAEAAAKAEGLTVTLTTRDLAHPALMDAQLMAAIGGICAARGYSHTSLPSGAGHDAQALATVAPAAMVFVPSRGGISHSPAEFTAAADCARGAQVLTDLLARLCLD